MNRTLGKLNYRIHTEAVKAHLIPAQITPIQAALTYANEADLLNVALFGQTAKQWRLANPDREGNIRDHATIEQLLVLTNMESLNAEFLRMELSQSERLRRLNDMAIAQIETLTAHPAVIKPSRKGKNQMTKLISGRTPSGRAAPGSAPASVPAGPAGWRPRPCASLAQMRSPHRCGNTFGQTYNARSKEKTDAENVPDEWGLKKVSHVSQSEYYEWASLAIKRRSAWSISSCMN